MLIADPAARHAPVEALERVLDKGVVIDAWVRVALIGIDLINVDARVVVASIETYLEHAPTPGLSRRASATIHATPGALLPPARRPRTPARIPVSGGRVIHLVGAALQAWNDHDVQRYAALLEGNYVGETHGVPMKLRGRRAARRAMRMMLAVFPDLRFNLQDVLSVGDDALVSWTATGTRDHEGVRVTGCTVAQSRDGKIDHTWCYWDTADMLAPLRVVRHGSHTLHRVATTS